MHEGKAMMHRSSSAEWMKIHLLESFESITKAALCHAPLAAMSLHVAGHAAACWVSGPAHRSPPESPTPALHRATSEAEIMLSRCSPANACRGSVPASPATHAHGAGTRAGEQLCLTSSFESASSTSFSSGAASVPFVSHAFKKCINPK